MRKGWAEVSVGEITALVKRGRAPAYTDDGVLVLSQKCVRDGRVDLGLGRRTNIAIRSVPAWAYVRRGDTLVNSTGTGTLGRVGYVANVSEPTTVDSHVAIVRPDPDRVEPAFLGLALHQQEPDLIALQSGSTNQTELSPAALAAVRVPLPPLAEQRRIVDLARSIEQLAARVSDELRASDRLRQALLADLSADGEPVSLTVLADLEYGTSLPERRRTASGFPVFGAAGIVGRHDPPTWPVGPVIVVGRKGVHATGSLVIPPRDDVLLSGHLGYRGIGGAGSVRWCPGPCSVIDTAYAVRPKTSVDLRLLYWVLVSANLPTITTKTTLPGLGRADAYAVTVRIPRGESGRLLDALDAADGVSVKAWLTAEKVDQARARLLAALLEGAVDLTDSYDRFIDGAP